MGIYDRDYYRERRGFWASIGGQATVCKWLIGINIVVWIVQLITWPHAMYTMGPVTDLLILNVDKVLHGEVWRLLTCAFLHDPSWYWHIIFNMIVLWYFGREMEEMYGSAEFLAFYLTAAVVSSLINVGSEWAYCAYHHLPLAEAPQALGASGAVMAVLVLFALHFPSRTIRVFFLIPVPAWLCVIIMVGIDSYGWLTGNNGGVAVAAHLGGAAFGFLYHRFQYRLTGLLAGLRLGRRRSRLRVYPDDEPTTPVAVAAPPPPSADVDEHFEAKVDAVLEKVSRYGQDSLTDSEKEILFRASEMYKKRRS
jgi:membrane associated rhomboid family serine protease